MSEIKKRQHKKVTYDKKKEVILSNEIIENCRYSLSSNCFTLLMVLGQAIDYTNSLFPEFEVDISEIFKFFNLKSNNNKRYEIVRDMFADISRNPLEIRKSLTNWAGIPWLAYEYNGDISTRIRVSFHPDVIPYLLAFQNTIGIRGYTKMLPEFYHNFESKYATWLYPFFKKWQDTVTYKEVTVKKTVRWVRDKTFTFKGKKYVKFSHWLERVVNAAINEINEKSDLYIQPISAKNNNIIAEEGGRKYTHIYFRISTKKNRVPTKETKSKDIEIRTLEALEARFSDIEEISQEVIHGLYNHQDITPKEAAAKSGKTYVKIGGKHYFCK